MKRHAWILVCSTAALWLVGCANNNNTSGTDTYGPFDADGTYREDWADDPTKWRRPGKKESPQLAKKDEPPANATPIAQSPPPVVQNTPPTRPAVSKPSPVASKPKPKPKPKPTVTRYAVKSGDNLYNIARKYGTSVTAIQRANSIKGTLIRPGQSLVIPKR